MENLQTLSGHVARIGHQVDIFPTHLAAPAPASQPSQPPPVASPVTPPKEPHVPAPERYSGDLGLCKVFLMQCSLVFEQQPSTYTTDV